MIRFSFIVISVLFSLTAACSFFSEPVPEIQIREDVADFTEIGNVSFSHYGYKGVFKIVLNSEIQKDEVMGIAKEIIERCRCKLVTPAFPEVKNPNADQRSIYVRDATDEAMLELSEDQRIKFIAQHKPDH